MEARACLLIFLAILAANIRTTQQQQCLSILDLIFVVDGSNSMGAANFGRQKASLVNLVKSLSISPDEVRAGLVLFSAEVNDVVNLTGNKELFIDQINALGYPDEETRTDLGIDTAITLFNAGGRNGTVPKLMIIITDGESTIPNKTQVSSANAKNQGINIFAIGVTNSTNVEELRKIASTSNQVFITEDFTTLEASLNNATNRACVDLQSTERPVVSDPPPVPACYMGQTDLWFVVDVSAAAENLSRVEFPGDFRQVKDGLRKMIEIMQDPSVANPGIRLGVIDYSETFRVLLDISGTDTVNRAASVIETIPAGVAQNGAFLVSALRNIANPPVVSSYLSYVAIVAPESSFTSDTARLEAELTRLKDLGYTIVIFAVRENGALDQQALQMDASGSKFFYYIPRYADLEAAAKNFTRDRLCNGLLVNNTGLCSGSGHKELGVGVVPHPMDCDKYIQCYYDDRHDRDIGVVRQCPMGLHWNSQNKTCTHPSEAMCAYDRCKEDCAAYKMEGACGAFWECEDGVSVLQCCQHNYTFIPEHGCQPDDSCTDTCGPGKWCGKCQKKPNWDKPEGYDVMILGGHLWMPRPCFYDDFDIVDCDCTAPRGHVCPADRTYIFNDTETLKAIDSGIKEGIRASDIQKTSNGISLGPKSAVHVKVNNAGSESRPFTLELRFREMEDFSPYGETLVSSGLDCGTGNRLLISASDHFIFAEIRSSSGSVAEVKVPTEGLNKEDFKDLVLSYDDGVFALSIKDEQTQYIATTQAPHNICFSCGLDFGQGLNKLSFDGEIQKIAVYSCAWPLLY